MDSQRAARHCFGHTHLLVLPSLRKLPSTVTLSAESEIKASLSQWLYYSMWTISLKFRIFTFLYIQIWKVFQNVSRSEMLFLKTPLKKNLCHVFQKLRTLILYKVRQGSVRSSNTVLFFKSFTASGEKKTPTRVSHKNIKFKGFQTVDSKFRFQRCVQSIRPHPRNTIGAFDSSLWCM